jgi:hypothetical protein
VIPGLPRLLHNSAITTSLKAPFIHDQIDVMLADAASRCKECWDSCWRRYRQVWQSWRRREGQGQVSAIKRFQFSNGTWCFQVWKGLKIVDWLYWHAGHSCCRWIAWFIMWRRTSHGILPTRITPDTWLYTCGSITKVYPFILNFFTSSHWSHHYQIVNSF